MPLRCLVCSSTRVIVEMAGETPRYVGCLTCSWADLLNTNEAGEVTQCISPNSYGKRCTRAVDVVGYCWQHANKRPEIWEEVYRAFRAGAGREGIPNAYLQIFSRALRDAGIAATPEKTHESLKRVKKARGNSVVYFVEREELIKIGVTTNLHNRLRAIGKGSSMPDGMTVGPVELLVATPGDESDERRYHLRFSKQRITGTEWFRPSKALRHLIEDLKRGQERGHPDAITVLDAALEMTAA